MMADVFCTKFEESPNGFMPIDDLHAMYVESWPSDLGQPPIKLHCERFMNILGYRIIVRHEVKGFKGCLLRRLGNNDDALDI